MKDIPLEEMSKERLIAEFQSLQNSTHLLQMQISELQTENMELRGDRVAHIATKSVLNKAHEHIAELEAEKCRKEIAE